MPTLSPRWLALGIAVAATSANALAADTTAQDRPQRWQDAVPPPRAVTYPGTLTLDVDARNTAQGIFSVVETLPVTPGPLVLLYPQWIPGNHSPTGPINKLAGLTITDPQGRRVAWTRDPLNVYAFHLEVPDGVETLTLRFQYLSPTSGDQGRIVMTPDLLNLQWGAVVLYPAGHDSDQITVRARLTLPPGFEAATALRPVV